jgi:hypothetical protein
MGLIITWSTVQKDRAKSAACFVKAIDADQCQQRHKALQLK